MEAAPKEGNQGSFMAPFRVLVCAGALVVALSPLAAFAANDTPAHLQDELANSQAQLSLAQQDAASLQVQAQDEATNERTIALLRSLALRERQLNLVANANAMEQIAAALANAARESGNAGALNDLEVARIQAAALLANVDANLANGRMMALTRGRLDELANAEAQSAILHQLANSIDGEEAELKMANSRQIGQDQADAIHTPAIAEAQNQIVVGANDLLAGDVALAAGELGANNVTIQQNLKASNTLGHAVTSLSNAQAQAQAGTR
jgi:hypothetical protein